MTARPTEAEIAADCRRATSLLLHHLNDDVEGVGAVLRESGEDGRAIELVLAVLDLIVFLVPRLDSDKGREALQRAILTLATQEAP